MKKSIILITFVINISFVFAQSGCGWNYISTVYYPSYEYTTDIDFVNSNVGWVVAKGLACAIDTFYCVNWGTIFKTSNGGSTWSDQYANDSIFFTLNFININIGYVGGQSGILVKTTNSGSNWNVLSYDANNSNDIYDIKFVNINKGWFVGANGSIRKTTNAGTSWNSQSSGTNQDLHSIFMKDSVTGWIAGNNGTILRTFTSGDSWETLNSGTNNNLSSIYFINSNIGWAAGDSGVILKTTNGGDTWTSQSSGTSYNLKKIKFTNSNIGWITGGYDYGTDGIILKTTNYGSNWVNQSVNFNFWGLSFPNSYTGYAGGYYTEVYKFSCSVGLTAPEIISPPNNTDTVSYQTKLTWHRNVDAVSYKLQVSTSSSFNTTIMNQIVSDTSINITGINPQTQYYWRVKTINPPDTSAWSDTLHFTTRGRTVMNIPLDTGWNAISCNILPFDQNIESLLAGIRNNMVIIKDGSGNYYVPGYGIDNLNYWDYYKGFQIYMSAADTLSITGDTLNPSNTSINLSQGWNVISYLRDSAMSVTSALAGIDSLIVVVKDGSGNFYVPSYNINTIGDMLPGKAYWVYMSGAGVLVYPGNN